MTERTGRTRIRKTAYTLLVIVFMLAIFRLGYLLVERSDERIAEPASLTTESTGTESITTFRFEDGTLTGRLSALSVGAAEDGARGKALTARFDGALVNRLGRAIRIRDVQAVTRDGARNLDEFRISFEKARVDAGANYVFSGAAPVSAEFFNGVVRRYDMTLRIATDIGALEMPLQVYTLEVESALAAGLLKTNQVRFGDAVGIINFLNCEQVSAHEVCEPMLEQMAVAP